MQFTDAELNKETSIKDFLIDVGDGRNFTVNHYNLQLAVGRHPPPTASSGRHKAAAGGVIRQKGDISVTACKRTQ